MLPAQANPQVVAHENRFKAHRSAHAGGGYRGIDYTNSLQALTENHQKGFIYFELDFSLTADGHLVCLHDWDFDFQHAFHFKPKAPLTLDVFEALARSHPLYTKCTLASLSKWMSSHPHAHIVTDTKEPGMAALAQIARQIPDASKRIIPQIYYPTDYFRVADMGFQQIIWSLYKLGNMNDDEVIDWATRLSGRLAIAMPPYRARTGLPKRLKLLGIPTYIHTINDPETLAQYKQHFGITEVYTDFLPPDDSTGISWHPPLLLPGKPITSNRLN